MWHFYCHMTIGSETQHQSWERSLQEEEHYEQPP
jgi:hypothetical protein